MKKFLIIILILIVVLIGVLLINALNFPSKQTIEKKAAIEITQSPAKNLSDAIKIKTISFDDASQFDSSSFKQLIVFLQQRYPHCDSLLEKETINKYSLLYKWKGKNSNLKPVILLAHNDVVPAEGKWDEDPFSGLIKDGYIWGRGSLDDKVGVLGILEATEKLLKENFTPERTIYFAFGHDEEVMGKNGASAIAALLKQRNIEAEFILDEGLVITNGIVPGIEKPVALIGVAEKGYISLKISTAVEGGHGSMPANENAVSVLSKAIIKIQDNPFPAVISEPVDQFLDYVGPEMPFLKKIIFANRWLFKSLVIGAYEKTPSGNAIVRSTVSPNIFKSGIKDNVIPADAHAVLNIRTLPGKSNKEVIDELIKIINDPRIKIETLNSLEPSAVSPVNVFGYKTLEKTIRQIFPETYVAPSLLVAGTDSKHYKDISKTIYRFLPIKLSKEDLKRIHGANEKIKEEDYKDVIRFYYQLIKNI